MRNGLLYTFTTGAYLTPKTLRRVKRHAGGWAIVGTVYETDPYARDEMLMWAKSFREIADYARSHNL